MLWIPQRKSSRKFGHGSSAALSMAKSADLLNGRATQHSAKQRSQSASRFSRELIVGMRRCLLRSRSGAERGPGPTPSCRAEVAPPSVAYVRTADGGEEQFGLSMPAHPSALPQELRQFVHPD